MPQKMDSKQVEIFKRSNQMLVNTTNLNRVDSLYILGSQVYLANNIGPVTCTMYEDLDLTISSIEMNLRSILLYSEIVSVL